MDHKSINVKGVGSAKTNPQKIVNGLVLKQYFFFFFFYLSS